MLALSLIYPQSVAVSFVATWAILGRLSVWLPGCRRVCHEYVLNATGGSCPGIAGREDCHALFLQPVPWRSGGLW
ncbi:putative protein lysA [Escherichia coli p0305293.7]|nr:putative protein lysA [Escherichia coli p0305293.7]